MLKYLLLTGVACLMSQGLYAANDASVNSTDVNFVKTVTLSKDKIAGGEFYNVSFVPHKDPRPRRHN